MIYIFLADGFEECEALVPLDLMRRAKIEVETVSVNKTTEVIGGHNISINADRTAKNLLRDIGDGENFEGIILPGGLAGANRLDEEAVVDSVLSVALLQDKLIAAICAAPFILGKRGYLRNKKAICYPGFENQLLEAVITDTGAVRDGNIITAKSAGYSFEFSYELIRYIKGLDAADQVFSAVYYKH